MNDFCEFLYVCELRDLGYEGSPFTWCKIREGGGRIFERLDRFLANSQWCDLFPLGSVQHGQVTYSDHYSIWLNTIGTRITRRKFKLFCFEAMWIKEAKCSNIVKDVWSSGNDQESIGHIMRVISKCGISLTQWNKYKFGNVQQCLFIANRALKSA